MRNISNFATIVLLAGLSLFQACKKDRTTVYVNNTPGGTPVVTPVVPTTSKFTTLSAFYKTMLPARQAFAIDASKGATIRGDRGYTFQIPPNAFRNMSGMQVTGNIKIELTEVSNYSEMMATGARTEAMDGVLASAAMFNITATQNGSPLFAAIPVMASIPVRIDADLSNMEKFTGIVRTNINNDTTINWISDTTFNYNGDSTVQNYDSLKKVYELKRIIKFQLKTLGWCNLDAYINNSSGFQVRATFTGINNILSGQAYMKLDQGNLKGLYMLTYDPAKDEFNSTYYNMPAAMNIHLIVLVKDKDLKVYMEDRVIVNASTTHNFSNLKEISDADLEKFFKDLDK